MTRHGGSDPVRVLMVAGEASGDLHGGRLLAALGELTDRLEVFGLGGDRMAAEGLEGLADITELSVVGLSEVFRVWSRGREIFHQILDEVDRRRPSLAVLIDFPEFNLRLAKALHARGVPVVYYISPQVWAWRKGRVKTMARFVDAVLVLFPFEAEFYEGHGVEAIHVGHPLVDEVPVLPQAWDRGAPEGEPFRIALLPGSRTSEVEVLLPVMLQSVRRLAADVPILARVIQAPTIPRRMIDEAVELSGLPVRVVSEDHYRVVADSHFALCASGTATLEVGLLGTPMAVLYRLGRWTYVMGRLLVRLPHVSLVNLVLGRGVVPELLQFHAEPEVVSRTLSELLRDPAAIARMRRGLGELRTRLGARGASERVAREVARRLGLDPDGPRSAAGPAPDAPVVSAREVG